MNNKEILEHLINLDVALAKANIKGIKIFILGGSALKLHSVIARATDDIDVVITDSKLEIIKGIDLLNPVNDDVVEVIPKIKFDDYSTRMEEKYTSFEAYLIDMEMIFVLKVLSSVALTRGSRSKIDSSDLKQMWEKKMDRAKIILAAKNVTRNIPRKRNREIAIMKNRLKNDYNMEVD